MMYYLPKLCVNTYVKRNVQTWRVERLCMMGGFISRVAFFPYEFIIVSANAYML